MVPAPCRVSGDSLWDCIGVCQTKVVCFAGVHSDVAQSSKVSVPRIFQAPLLFQ